MELRDKHWKRKFIPQSYSLSSCTYSIARVNGVKSRTLAFYTERHKLTSLFAHASSLCSSRQAAAIGHPIDLLSIYYRCILRNFIFLPTSSLPIKNVCRFGMPFLPFKLFGFRSDSQKLFNGSNRLIPRFI